MRPRVALLLLGLAVPAFAQPRSLAAFLPHGAGFVARVQKAEAACDRLAGTPLADAVCKGSFAEYIKASPWVRELETAAGLPAGEAIMRLGGGEVICAWYGGATPLRPEWVLLLRGRDGVDAAPIVKRVIDACLQKGQLQALAPPPGNGLPFRSFRRAQGGDLVVAAHGALTMASSSAGLARKVMDLAGGKSSDSLLADRNLRETCRDLVEDAEVPTFLDVRVIRRGMDERPRKLPGALMYAAAISTRGVAADTTLKEEEGGLVLSTKAGGVTPALAVTPSALILTTSTEFTGTFTTWTAAPPPRACGRCSPPSSCSAQG